MKRKIIIVLIAAILVASCATRQTYYVPPPKTQSNFFVDREQCTEISGYGNLNKWWLVGPLIIIFPAVIVIESIEASRQKDFQRCMMQRGYACTKSCWDIDNVVVTNVTAESTSSEEISAPKKPEPKTMRQLKVALKTGLISKAEYKSRARLLEAQYKMAILQIEQDYANGIINVYIYKNRMRKAKQDFKG